MGWHPTPWPPAGPRPKLEAPSLRCLGRRHDSHPRATRAESNRWGNDGKMQATPPLLGSTPPGKSPLLVGEFTINGPFSIAMLNYQRVIYIYIYLWLVVWNIKKSIYWECHHPNWRTHIFQTGRYTSNQICIYIYIYIDRDRNFVMGFCWGLSESFFLVTRMLLFDANVGKVLACTCFCREHWWKNNGCPLWRWCRCADLYPSSYSLQYLFHHQETPEI